jgi:hypothetical protein
MVGGGPRGVLSFLQDPVTFFPYDADVCRKKVSQPVRHQKYRQRKKRNQSSALPQIGAQEQALTPTVESNNTTLSKILAENNPSVVVLFFYQPLHHVYSIKIRNALLAVLHAEDDGEWKGNVVLEPDEGNRNRMSNIIGCAIALNGKRGDTPSPSLVELQFLEATGMVAADIDYKNMMAWHHVFAPRVQSTPHIMLVNTGNGKIFGTTHEEQALEWNSPATVRQRWLQGESGLDCTQQILLSILFPTSCTVM